MITTAPPASEASVPNSRERPRSRAHIAFASSGGRAEKTGKPDHNLEQRRERSGFGLDAGCDDRLSAVREHDDVAGFDVRSGMLEESEVVASWSWRR